METITRLSRVINDLLLLAQTDSADRFFEYDAVRLDDLARDVVEDTKVLAEMKRQRLTCGTVDPVVVRGDRDRLYQVIFNLIDNAVKYTPEGGDIQVDVNATDGYANLQVRDDGPGIPEADQPHVFDRFYRVAKDRSRKTGGSGLGLAICRMTAEAHGGAITVESKPGEGSCFRVRLPVMHDA
jgi:signal transduction histidine kinase